MVHSERTQEEELGEGFVVKRRNYNTLLFAYFSRSGKVYLACVKFQASLYFGITRYANPSKTGHERFTP